jgi:amidohydrolase
MNNYLNEAKALFPYTRTLRRDFHMHPELGFNELRTGGIVARELEELGIEVTKGVGKTGVVGLLEGAKPGPTVLLRFDMDALPIRRLIRLSLQRKSLRHYKPLSHAMWRR